MAEPQIEAIGVFSKLESWWGEEFSYELVDRIVDAPTAHLERFAEDSELDNRPLSVPGHLPLLEEGEVRPVWGDIWESVYDDDIAARLLLYVDSVVENYDRIDISNRIYREISTIPRKGQSQNRALIRSHLEWLLQMRPLIEDGSVLFTNKDRGLSYAMLGHDELWTGLGVNPPSDEHARATAWSLLGNIAIAREGGGTALAVDEKDDVIYRSFVSGHKLEDERVTLASTLARLPLPDFRSDIASLVAVRRNEDSLRRWRGVLKESLRRVRDVADKDEGVAEAAAILRADLKEATASLEKDIKGSPALAALRVGVAGFAFTGIGAAAGGAASSALVPGSSAAPLVGALAGAVPGSVEVVREMGSSYINAARRRRPAKAVWDIIARLA